MARPSPCGMRVSPVRCWREQSWPALAPAGQPPAAPRGTSCGRCARGSPMTAPESRIVAGPAASTTRRTPLPTSGQLGRRSGPRRLRSRMATALPRTTASRRPLGRLLPVLGFLPTMNTNRTRATAAAACTTSRPASKTTNKDTADRQDRTRTASPVYQVQPRPLGLLGGRFQALHPPERHRGTHPVAAAPQARDRDRARARTGRPRPPCGPRSGGRPPAAGRSAR